MTKQSAGASALISLRGRYEWVDPEVAEDDFVEHQIDILASIEDVDATVGTMKVVETGVSYVGIEELEGAEFWIMDSHSSELLYIHEAIVAQLDDLVADGPIRPVVLSSVFIEPEYRGKGLGEAAIKLVIKQWMRYSESVGYMFLVVEPPALLRTPSGSPMSGQKQQDDAPAESARLRQWYERLGFEHLSTQDVMGLNLRLLPPWMRDARS